MLWLDLNCFFNNVIDLLCWIILADLLLRNRDQIWTRFSPATICHVKGYPLRLAPRKNNQASSLLSPSYRVKNERVSNNRNLPLSLFKHLNCRLSLKEWYVIACFRLECRKNVQSNLFYYLIARVSCLGANNHKLFQSGFLEAVSDCHIWLWITFLLKKKAHCLNSQIAGWKKALERFSRMRASDWSHKFSLFGKDLTPHFCVFCQETLIVCLKKQRFNMKKKSGNGACGVWRPTSHKDMLSKSDFLSKKQQKHIRFLGRGTFFSCCLISAIMITTQHSLTIV